MSRYTEYSIILAIFRHDREALIGNEIHVSRAKSCMDLSSAKFLDSYLSRERRRRPRVNCTSCTSSLSESHYLNASANGGRVSYKFATQYHFIIAWHPRYELWNEAHVRLCSVSHRAGGYNTSEQKVISTRMMLVQVAAYGIIMRRNTRAAIRLEAYSGILNYSANNKDNRDANSV